VQKEVEVKRDKEFRIFMEGSRPSALFLGGDIKLIEKHTLGI